LSGLIAMADAIEKNRKSRIVDMTAPAQDCLMLQMHKIKWSKVNAADLGDSVYTTFSKGGKSLDRAQSRRALGSVEEMRVHDGVEHLDRIDAVVCRNQKRERRAMRGTGWQQFKSTYNLPSTHIDYDKYINSANAEVSSSSSEEEEDMERAAERAEQAAKAAAAMGASKARRKKGANSARHTSVTESNASELFAWEPVTLNSSTTVYTASAVLRYAGAAHLILYDGGSGDAHIGSFDNDDDDPSFRVTHNMAWSEDMPRHMASEPVEASAGKVLGNGHLIMYTTTTSLKKFAEPIQF
jgi:hypothetical protein